MKKATYEIDIFNGGKEQVSGLVGKTFGYHKVLEASYPLYSVTHLLTGYKIYDFYYAFQARAFCLKAEEMIEKGEWAAPWDTTNFDILKKNAQQAYELKLSCRRLEWGQK